MARPRAGLPPAHAWLLGWLAVLPLALLVPATTIFRRGTFWIGLNLAAVTVVGCYVGWSFLRAWGPPRWWRRAGIVVAMTMAGAVILGRVVVREASSGVILAAWASQLATAALGCALAGALVKDLLLVGVTATTAVRRSVGGLVGTAGGVRRTVGSLVGTAGGVRRSVGSLVGTAEGVRRTVGGLAGTATARATDGGSVGGAAAWERRLAVGAAMVAAALLLVGMGEALRTPRVTVVDVPVAGLPRGLDDLRVVQLTDLHVGQTVGAGFVGRVVARVNELDADLVVITGDLVDHRPATTAGKLAALEHLRARHGTFFVSGNHERAWGARAWERELRSLGVTVLRDECRAVRVGPHRVTLLGLSDRSARRLGRRLPAGLARARCRPQRGPTILLSHQARGPVVRAARRRRVDLVLAGHSHGGQCFPGQLLAARSQPWIAGRHRLGSTWLYVSRGTGYWGPPLRLGAPSEITLLRLRRAA